MRVPKLGLILKLTIPLAIIYAALFFFTVKYLLDLYETELIKISKSNGLSATSQAAMQFDTGSDTDILKRVTTIIALDDSVLRALVLTPTDNSILASSQYRYATHTLDNLPPQLLTTYLKARETGTPIFSTISKGRYSLAYPVTALSPNDTDSLEFIILVHFDTAQIVQQYYEYQTTISFIALFFLVLLIALTYLLLSFVIRNPLIRFSALIQNPEAEDLEQYRLKTNDEFEQIADELIRMRHVEHQSLLAEKQATKAAQDLANRKTEFLANMSHEVRTPLNGMMGIIQLAQQTESIAEKERFLEQMQDTSRLLLKVVNDVLDFSKMNEGALQLHNETVVLSSLLLHVSGLTQVLLDTKPIKLEVQISPDCPYSITTDQYRLQQVLINLLSNAVKFTAKGSIRVSADFRLQRQSQNTGELIIYVEDTGIGIPKEKIESLFDPFEQGDNSTSRHYGGTGLGLSISKSILTLMKGAISVASQPGAGTQFTIQIPCEYNSLESQVDSKLKSIPLTKINYDQRSHPRTKYVCDLISSKSNSKKERSIQSLDPNILIPPYLLDEAKVFSALLSTSRAESDENCRSYDRSAKVLLVEDNDINAMVGINMLKKMNHQVIRARDGAEAIKIFNKVNVDIILMDIQMPVLDGFKATEAIRLQDKFISIVGLSANVLDEDEKRAINCGMNAYLHKPVVFEELKDTIQNELMREKAWS